MTEQKLTELEARIEKIETRNHRVEADKAWETSTFRAILLFVVTYIFVAVFFIGVNEEEVWLHALEPAAGVFLSGFVFNFIKERWISRKRGQK